MKLTKDASDRFEQWKHEQAMIEEGLKVQVEEGLSYEGFVEALEGVRTMRELIDRINAYDPYNYQIIFAYDANSLWCGVKIRVQLYKGQTIYMVPKDHMATIYVPISTHMIRNKIFTVLKSKKEKNSYDTNGSLPATS